MLQYILIIECKIIKTYIVTNKKLNIDCVSFSDDNFEISRKPQIVGTSKISVKILNE